MPKHLYVGNRESTVVIARDGPERAVTGPPDEPVVADALVSCGGAQQAKAIVRVAASACSRLWRERA